MQFFNNSSILQLSNCASQLSVHSYYACTSDFQIFVCFILLCSVNLFTHTSTGMVGGGWGL